MYTKQIKEMAIANRISVKVIKTFLSIQQL